MRVQEMTTIKLNNDETKALSNASNIIDDIVAYLDDNCILTIYDEYDDTLEYNWNELNNCMDILNNLIHCKTITIENPGED